MEQQTALTQAAAPEADVLNQALTEALEQTRRDFPVIVDKVNRNCMALSAIKAIENDEQDEKVEALLVRTKNTYELVNKMRKVITEPLDGLKTKLMEPEKRISNLASDKGNEFYRVKSLRDSYVAEKVRKQKEEADKLEKERQRGIEIARLKAVFETRFFNNIMGLIGDLRWSLDTYFGSINLEKFNEAKIRLNAKPSLKPDVFESWFATDHKLSPEDFTAFMDQVRAQYTYDSISGKYFEQANPIIQEYRDRLPAKKIELENIAKMDADAAAAETARLEEKRKADLAAKELEDSKVMAANAEDATRASQMEQLEVNFSTQLVQQTHGVIKGARTRRIPIVECLPEDIVKVFSQVLLQCFLSPKFKGYCKRNGVGQPVTDERGVPEYTKWADELLTFFADNCDTPIPGIRFIDDTKSTQRGK